jgi:hypothetical protein
MKHAQMLELAQGLQAHIGHGSAPKLRFDNKRRKSLESRKLRIVEAGGNVDCAKDEAVGRVCRYRDQLCPLRLLHLANVGHERAVVIDRLELLLSVLCNEDSWDADRLRRGTGQYPSTNLRNLVGR